MRLRPHRRSPSAGIISLVGVAALCVAVFGSFTAASALRSTSAKGPLNEAIVIAYTGPVSFEGLAADGGVYPGVSEINAAGGINGHKVNIVPVDTKGDPADAVPLVDKLIATTSNLIGASGIGTASAPTEVPILNAAGVTMMTFAGETAFNRSHYKYLWRLLPPDDANGKAMDLYAKSKGYKRVATVFGTTTGAQGDLPGVLSGLKGTGEKLVAKITLTPNQPSYRAEVEKLIAANPQVIFTEQNATTAVTFFSELKSLGHLIQSIGTNALVTSSWENAVRKAMGRSTFKRVLTVLSTSAPHKTPANAAYARALATVKSKVGSPWTQWEGNSHSQAAYDGVIVQALAMTAAHSVTPKVYNTHIMAVTEPGRGKTVVYTYAAGVRALKAGKKIQYYGAGGPIVFDKYHNSFGNQEAMKISTHDTTIPIATIPEREIQALG